MIKEVPVIQTKEVIKIKKVVQKVPVPVIKEVIKEVKVEVPVIQVVEKVKIKNIVKKVPVTKTKEKIKKVEVIKEVPVEKLKEVEVIKEVVKKVPVALLKTVEKIKEVDVIKEVPVLVQKSVIKEVKVKETVPTPVLKEITNIREVVKRDEKAMAKLTKELDALKAKIKKNEKTVATAKTAATGYERLQKQISKLKDANKALTGDLNAWKKKKNKVVVKEVPVEIIKEVEVVKGYDMKTLQKMLMQMSTKETSRKVVGTTTNSGNARVVERREVTDGSRTKVTAKPTVVSSKSTTKTTKSSTTRGGKKDDLTKIEGIGPKIAELLTKAGISSFQKLADSKFGVIKTVLTNAGPKFQMHDPTSWPQQSSLAAAGEWDKLKVLQDKLDGGK